MVWVFFWAWEGSVCEKGHWGKRKVLTKNQAGIEGTEEEKSWKKQKPPSSVKHEKEKGVPRRCWGTREDEILLAPGSRRQPW